MALARSSGTVFLALKAKPPRAAVSLACSKRRIDPDWAGTRCSRSHGRIKTGLSSRASGSHFECLKNSNGESSTTKLGAYLPEDSSNC